MLFPPFQYVLQRDVSEFTPYVFQILAQLLECRSGLSAAYSSLFPPLLLPTMWERPANVPALTRLLTAYIAVGKEAVAPQLEKVLGVFQKLLASKATDSHACLLLGAIWRSFELAELASFINPIFTLCLQRLQSNKKVGASMVRCWSVFVARHGPAAFRAQLESIQPNLFAMLIRGVWADSLNAVSGGVIARKGAAIATARLLTECPELVGDQQTFGVLLQAMLLMLLSDQGQTAAAGTFGAADDDDAEDAGLEGGSGGVGYVAAYAALSFASPSNEVDFYANETAPAYARSALHGLHQRAATVLPTLIPPMVAGLPPEQQQGVQTLLQGVC